MLTHFSTPPAERLDRITRAGQRLFDVPIALEDVRFADKALCRAEREGRNRVVLV